MKNTTALVLFSALSVHVQAQPEPPAFTAGQGPAWETNLAIMNCA